MIKKRRGSQDYRVETTTNVICLRWLDTKAVTLMSNYCGSEPLDKARRWDKGTKEYIQVDMMGLTYCKVQVITTNKISLAYTDVIVSGLGLQAKMC